MTIRLAASSGFCFGVRRAIQMALSAAEGKNNDVYTIGELIHNPQFVQELTEKGIKICNDVSSLRDSTVIIRSHGITRQELETLIANRNRIIDATCPYVSRTHEFIKNAIDENYDVIILGDKNHPEVIGMLSYGNSSTKVVAPGEIPKDFNKKRLCLISQTTQKIEDLNNLVCEILPQLIELKIFNTICLATTQRQIASAKLAKHSDLMIVIGGKQSSNTKMLASMCSKYCQTVHIETEDELTEELFLGKQYIGITAGASTPESRIVKVYNKVLKINGEEDLVTSIQSIPLFKEESC
nr:hypothetical protein [Candidatus Cloacimonadota bacterium]